MPINLNTAQGEISCDYYPAPNANCGAIWADGVNNSQGSSVEWLYSNCAETLAKENIASLRIYFRNSRDFADSEHDILAGLAFLQTKGIDSVALIGHSFGGAVVIRVAATLPAVKTVITLATKSLGADCVTDLKSDCSILFMHGTDDPVLSPGCSQYLHELTKVEKSFFYTQKPTMTLNHWLKSPNSAFANGSFKN